MLSLNMLSPQTGFGSCFIFLSFALRFKLGMFRYGKSTHSLLSSAGKVCKNDFLLCTSPKRGFVGSPVESGRIKACVSAVQRDVCFNRVSEAMVIDTITVGSVCLKLSGGQMDWGGRVRGAVQNRPHTPSLIAAPVESFSTFTELLMLSCRTIKGGERRCWDWHAKMAISTGMSENSDFSPDFSRVPILSLISYVVEELKSVSVIKGLL